jgi:hypothetical protein
MCIVFFAVLNVKTAERLRRVAVSGPFTYSGDACLESGERRRRRGYALKADTRQDFPASALIDWE